MGYFGNTVLYRVFTDAATVARINDKYPFSWTGLIDDMYIGEFTHSEAREARRIFGAKIEHLTMEEEARAWGY